MDSTSPGKSGREWHGNKKQREKRVQGMGGKGDENSNNSQEEAKIIGTMGTSNRDREGQIKEGSKKGIDW